MENQERKDLATEMVRSGKKTYWFNLKEAKNGKPYLIISETVQKEEGYDRNSILVFDNDFENFKSALEKTLSIAKQPAQAAA